MNGVSPQGVYRAVSENIERILVGQEGAVRKLLAVLTGGGHVLLEDFPGTGKTTLAKSLALSIDAEYRRIQFTPDLLPTDILGVTIWDQGDSAFHFHPGPVFTNILLADEINRASPRTQSALLEAMGEAQVSVEGHRKPLRDLFFVIATQNPVESRGTYPLPEAQMDRFTARFSLGYVAPEQEVAILAEDRTGRLASLEPRASLAEIVTLRTAAAAVSIRPELQRYIVDLVGATRSAPGVDLGASPRASLALMGTAKALALFDGLGFVTPEHIQEMAVAVLAHRLVMSPQARFSGETPEALVDQLLEEIPVPS
jgi:MoxR-like ATPase